jgi:DedD protein
MDRRVKERLVGASILAALIVLIAPELLSGPPSPAPPPPGAGLPVSAPEPLHHVTVDLATSRASAPEPVTDAAAASGAPPARAHSAAAPGAPDAGASTGTDAGFGPGANEGSGAGIAPSLSATPRPAPPGPLESGSQPPTSPVATAKPAGTGRAWAIQLGSFASRANADKLVRQLKAQGFSVYVLPGGSGASLRYRVRIGPMADRGAAGQAAAKLKALGYVGSVVPPAA